MPLSTIGPAGLDNINGNGTGGFQIPSGTTAERPGSPVSGTIRFNSSAGGIEVFNGTSWISTFADGLSANSPAPSANYLKNVLGAKTGSYYIQTGYNNEVNQVFCDMHNIDGGGWTLIGKCGGGAFDAVGWLVSNLNGTGVSTTATLSAGTFACVDARGVAARSREVCISSYDMSKWVKCYMHSGITRDTIFAASATQAVIYNDAITLGNSETRTAVAWNGGTTAVYVNKYMVMALSGHDGSTPAWTLNNVGNTNVNDYSMAVAWTNTSRYGFTAPSNGRDAPYDGTWPNTSYNTGQFYGLVWVR